MALIIDKEHPSGITLNYWNILSVDLSVENMVNSANIKLRGYINKPLRESGHTHYHIETLHVSGIKDKLLLDNGNVFQALYEIVKSQDGWTTATDDI